MKNAGTRRREERRDGLPSAQLKGEHFESLDDTCAVRLAERIEVNLIFVV
jgi:hypothetical protein